VGALNQKAGSIHVNTAAFILFTLTEKPLEAEEKAYQQGEKLPLLTASDNISFKYSHLFFQSFQNYARADYLDGFALHALDFVRSHHQSHSNNSLRIGAPFHRRRIVQNGAGKVTPHDNISADRISDRNFHSIHRRLYAIAGAFSLPATAEAKAIVLSERSTGEAYI
jgi:hypothetical protein